MMDQTPRTVRPGFWALVGAGEPFRLLFPLGVVLGIVGVMLWPLYLWGPVAVYPSIAHPRVMIEGFLSAFVLGFLGTALPRLLEVPRVRLGETLGYAGGLLLLSGLHIFGQTAAGDGVFLSLMLLFVGRLLWRVQQRRDLPPPQFVMVAFGLASALVGAGVMVAAGFAAVPEWLYLLAATLLYYGYLLFPVLGIGAFLLPRFMGLPPREAGPDSPTPTPQWWAGVRETGVFALLILGGLILAALTGKFVMLAVMSGLYISRMLAGTVTPAGSLPRGFRLALWTVPLGFALAACFPQWRVAWMHLVLITGFNLLTYIVATRVIFGHGGQSHRFGARLWPVTVMSVCLWVATISRIGGEWLSPEGRLLHFAYAAIFWIIGTLVWAVAVLPGVRLADSEPS